MQSSSSGDLSLINDAEFLEELEQFDPVNERTLGPKAHSRTTYADAFGAHESGLPTNAGAPEHSAPEKSAARYERAWIDEPYEAPDQPASAGTHVPFKTAALVLVACLTSGAATAAFVFHDRLSQIIAPRTATR